MATLGLPKIEMEKKLLEKTLSLKDISLRRMAVIFWCQTDILASFPEERLGHDTEDLIKDMLSKFQLPSTIKEKMKCLVVPIGAEIIRWKWYHEIHLNIFRGSFETNILKHLCWTVLGTLDYRKTAKNLIDLEKFDLVVRYRLACLYCLDDDVPILWGKLPEEKQRYFYEEGISRVEYLQLEFCWPYILKGEEIKLDDAVKTLNQDPSTFNLYAFHHSAIRGNISATEYFLKMLTYDEIEDSLLNTARNVLSKRIKCSLSDVFPEGKFSEIFFYLLFLMTPEQQMELFKLQYRNILFCLLDWPWAELFMDIAELFWDFITIEDYVFLLENISLQIAAGISYQKIFQEFFLRGPADFKTHFLHHECRSATGLTAFLFITLSRIENADVIKVIFRNIDSVGRKTLVSSWHVCNIFYTSLSEGHWNIVELYLQEASLSKKDKTEVMKAFLSFLESKKVKKVELRGSIWKRFFQFFDENKEKVLTPK